MNKYFKPENYKKRFWVWFFRITHLIFMGTDPVSRRFGLGFGLPIDRYYIKNFLEKNKDKIKGTVIEVGDRRYSNLYLSQIAESEVLHFTTGNPEATLVADLSKIHTLPENMADCFICIQTFPFIYDLKNAIAGSRKMLKPGGFLLASVSGISQISRHDMDRWGDYWRMTTLSAKKMFGEIFGEDNVQVEAYGNCLTACSFLKGLSSKELTKHQLNKNDPDYELVITILARKI